MKKLTKICAVIVICLLLGVSVSGAFSLQDLKKYNQLQPIVNLLTTDTQYKQYKSGVEALIKKCAEYNKQQVIQNACQMMVNDRNGIKNVISDEQQKTTIRPEDSTTSSEDTRPQIINRQINCTELPSNAQWNTVSNITQTNNGNGRTPNNIGVHNTTPSSTVCRFVCKNEYQRDGQKCINNETNTSTNPQPETPIPENSQPETPKQPIINTPEGILSILTNESTNTSKIMVEGSKNKLVDFGIDIRNGAINISHITIAGNNFPRDRDIATLSIGGKSYTSAIVSPTQIIFEINEPFAMGPYKASVSMSVGIYSTDNYLNGMPIDVNTITIAYDDKTQTSEQISLQHLAVKAFPNFYQTLHRLEIWNASSDKYDIKFRKNDIHTIGAMGISGIKFANKILDEFSLEYGFGYIRYNQMEFIAEECSNEGKYRIDKFSYNVMDNDKQYTYTLTPEYTNVVLYTDKHIRVPLYDLLFDC